MFAEFRADVYEPWVPEVGDRVRIRISPECQFEEHKRIPVVDGVSGTVRNVADMPLLPALRVRDGMIMVDLRHPINDNEAAHRVLVESDLLADGSTRWAWLACVELSPVSEDTNPRY